MLQNKSFRNAITLSTSLDPDQARLFVGPGLGPNYLQLLSAGDTGSLLKILSSRYRRILSRSEMSKDSSLRVFVWQYHRYQCDNLFTPLQSIQLLHRIKSIL